MIFKKLFNITEALIFPKQCLFCNQLQELDRTDALCPHCKESVTECEDLLCCEKCGKPVTSYGKKQRCYFCNETSPLYFDRIISVYPYETTVSKAIQRYKTQSIQTSASGFGNIIVERFRKEFNPENFDLICGAPAHQNSLHGKTFDNVELMCKVTAKELGIPFEKGLLRKVRETKKQTELSYRQRLTNLQHSMDVSDYSKTRDKRILLLDDVCTTRATIIECSRALKKAGAKNITAITIATTNHVKEKYHGNFA